MSSRWAYYQQLPGAAKMDPPVWEALVDDFHRAAQSAAARDGVDLSAATEVHVVTEDARWVAAVDPDTGEPYMRPVRDGEVPPVMVRADWVFPDPT